MTRFEPEEKELLAHLRQVDVNTFEDEDFKRKLLAIVQKWDEVIDSLAKEEYNKYYLKNSHYNPKFVEHMEKRELQIDGSLPTMVSKIRILGMISPLEFNNYMKEYDEDFVEGFFIFLFSFFIISIIIITIAIRSMDYYIGRIITIDEAFTYGGKFDYNFLLSGNDVQAQGLPLSIQPEFKRFGRTGTIGAVINISFNNSMTGKDYEIYAADSTIENDYIISAAHVPFRIFKPTDRSKQKIIDQIKVFNEKNIFASFSIEPTIDYALLPCTDLYEQQFQMFVKKTFATSSTAPQPVVIEELKFANLDIWFEIWPNISDLAFKKCTVYKRGFTTGQTVGTMFTFPNIRTGLYQVVANEFESFSEKGDSGAVVFVLIPTGYSEAGKLFPIGLHVSGENADQFNNKKVSNFIPLYEVFKDFCKK